MSRRRRPVMTEDEEVTGLAGWLYTDLLLGLAVVFLGAISFTVIKPAEAVEGEGTAISTSSTSTSSTTSTTLAPQPCTIFNPGSEAENYRIQLRSGSSLEDVESELSRIRGRLGLPQESRVVLALVFGGGPTNADGRIAAQRFWQTLQTLSEEFTNATPRFLADSSLRGGSFNVDVFMQTGDCNT